MVFYREYECNLSAPYVRGWKGISSPRVETTDLQTDEIEIANQITFTDNDIKMIAGKFPLSTTHTFTPTELSCLGERECNGELTLYLNNDIYVNVTMAVIVRSASTTLQALIYQRVGNFTSVEAALSGNNVVFTVSPAATCSWIFRGI